jgi:2-hydroxy-3-keto-5-methylthiopentenyl-1-phosphate phosphatase
MNNTNPQPILFLDFDGTISSRDAIDAILEAFADEEWLKIEDDWRQGRIGSRECLAAQVQLVRARAEEINELLSSIEVDEGFNALLETCERNRVATHIISDGFDYCIKLILANAAENDRELARRLARMRICASHLEIKNGRWQTAFPFFARACVHGCATCKPAVIEMLNPNAAPVVFVGDGLSDRYAARAADVVFAKKSLAAYCAAQAIEFIAYENLRDVAREFEELLRVGAIRARNEADAPLVLPVGA